jgi:hypothetical protein
MNLVIRIFPCPVLSEIFCELYMGIPTLYYTFVRYLFIAGFSATSHCRILDLLSRT